MTREELFIKSPSLVLSPQKFHILKYFYNTVWCDIIKLKDICAIIDPSLERV